MFPIFIELFIYINLIIIFGVCIFIIFSKKDIKTGSLKESFSKTYFLKKYLKQ